MERIKRYRVPATRRSHLGMTVGLCIALACVACVPAPSPTASPARSDQPSETESKAGAQTVDCTIDFGDGVQVTITITPQQFPISAEDLMRQVAQHPRAPRIELEGSGLTAFVAAIDNLDSSRGYGWQYEVDGKRAERGIGQTELSPGSTLVWKHKRWD